MQASQRARDLDRLYQGRQRGHAPQISISDDSHHVTDAIGSMYGANDEDDYASSTSSTLSQHNYEQSQDGRSSRPLSFVPSPLGETITPYSPDSPSRTFNGQSTGTHRVPSHEKNGSAFGYHGPLSPTSPTADYPGGARTGAAINGRATAGAAMSNAAASPSTSPTTSSLNRSPSGASQHFPMTDLDSEAAVAQEFSNLQAIRRMSMGVVDAGADPDLPSFNSGGFHVPALAPAHDADEQDPARMFWVPASVHPELAPKAFESFIQDRVKTIKRSSLSMSSGVSSSLSPSSADGNGSLRRKKSMLSRQVKDGSGYQDGAERLERKRSSLHRDGGGLPSLQELEDLAQDPSSLVRRLSIDGQRTSLEAASDTAEGQQEDMPILPPKPLGQGLKRSTKTTYRRGSQRKGDRLAGRRGMRGSQDGDHGDEPPVPSLPKADEAPQLPAFSGDFGSFDDRLFGSSLQRVQTEPTQPKPRAVENFSRPGRKAQTPPLSQDEFGYDVRPTSPEDRRQNSPSPESHMFPPRSSSARSPPPAVQQMQVPTIVETPPPPQEHGRPYSAPGLQRPERVSSMDSQQPNNRIERPTLNRPASLQQARGQQSQQKTTFDQIGATGNQQPQPAIPSQNTRTDSLSIIPTYETDKKPEKKGKDKKDDGTRKSSWSWLTGGEDKEKDKDSGSKKSKQKMLSKPTERTQHDDTRLDVLQTQIDGNKPRESLVLERAQVQIEQPKTPGKKSSDGKKEKDSGLFSSLFGGSKKKSDKDSSSRSKSSASHRGLSPEPPQRKLQPDVDYNWTRFSILEERAIYRMAHIKLANPRRELYSQVLLSNFMYSYLAKVQQMHPQIQIPQSAAQKKQMQQERKKAEREAAQQGAGGGQQPEEFAQYQRYQEQQARAEGSLSSNSTPPRTGSLIDGARNAHSLHQDPQHQQQANQYSHYGHVNGNSGSYNGSVGQQAYASQPSHYDYSGNHSREAERSATGW
ncbi:hypothetical protein, variant [Verruconis gallopava]|uniref:Protein Zds1 C-terminal domain-containing protein n=1 Tax=Verruconis gallopava TaxID=253628 RepID=A0A0D1XNW4_9PEZI|nr:hypothetical protein, variant [Verruconis gallopava]KIW04266.1 hypothetical protein, variant [Verruconis gallopava]